MIIDYSTSRPSVALLKSVGVTAVGRYIGWDSVPGYPSIGKNLSKFEADELTANGISIFLAFEYNPDAAARGSTQGSQDATLAHKQLAALNAPPSMGVYFAVDYDLPDYAPSLPDTPQNAAAKLGPVASYFKAINSLNYPYAVGVYGGYWAVKRVLDANLATLSWQTVAWSGTNLDPRAVLYQVLNSAPVMGADVNVREHATTQPDYGQWPRPTVPVPAPPPPPSVIKKEKEMIILKVTAPAGNSWTGTRTFLYNGSSAPTHIVSGPDQTAFAAVLSEVTVTWNQFTAIGGK